MPEIVLATSLDNDVPKVNPGLPNQVCFLVVVEDRNLELVVVWRIVDSESKLLVPLGRLASSYIGRRLFGLFAETGSTVRVLLSNGLAIGQVLGAVDNGDKGADEGSISAEVGEDAGGVHPIEGVGL